MTRKELTSTSAALAAGLALMAGMAQAHFIGVGGNNSIDGSLCVGNDCVAEEAFGFDTIRVKENNLRFHFDDTSVAAAFPRNDWRLTANDSANGGDSHFSLEDATAGRFVFRIFAGARSNALVVDSQGDLGLGTTTPATDIDIKTGDTPTVRLQQDGTSGFTPQTWDVAGNEAGFFVRDATNGSQLSLRIRPNSPASSVDVFPAGVSIGSSTVPTGKLHVRNGDGSLDGIRVTNTGTNANLLRLENTNAAATGVGFILDPSGGADFWQMTATANENIFRINRTGGNGTEFELNNLGNLTISGGLISSGGGGACTVGDPCDAVFDPEVYTVPSIADHAAEMWAKGHLPAVGPTEPDQPLNMTVKMLRMLNELEHAHIYIAELHAELGTQNLRIEAQNGRIEAQNGHIEAQNGRIEAQSGRIEALERLVASD